LKWVRNIEIWNKLVRKKEEDYQVYQEDEEDHDEEVQEDEGLRKP